MKKATQGTQVLLVVLAVLVGWLGARLAGTSTAEAQQQGPFRECTALSLHWHDGAAFANPAWQPQTIRIRPGWTVVGGAGVGSNGGSHPYAVVCR